MAEVIKISGTSASAQVFESTRGVKLGDAVEFTGSMLEIELGPGLLGKNFDGLQNDLDKLQGVFWKEVNIIIFLKIKNQLMTLLQWLKLEMKYLPEIGSVLLKKVG